MKVIKPIKDEDYTVTRDDGCVLVQCHNAKMWLSPKLLEWLSLNADKVLND